MELVRLCDGRGVTFTLLCYDMKENRLILFLQKFERLNQQRNIVAVNRSIIAQAQVLKNNAGKDKMFHSFLNLMYELVGIFAADNLDELRRFFVQVAVGIARDQFV